nr:reverse transcriptase domain-containing protein [Tanacetum cinerariifolium]
FIPDDIGPIYDTDPEVDEPGHPWQFDRKTKYDGFQNTYSFKKDGVNVTLVPFDSSQTQAKGSAIPNKPAYRMNPKEFAEFQRYVTELLEKGLIRESMSSCVVPKYVGTFRMWIDSRAVNKITINGIKIEPTKVEAIISWPKPSTIHDIRSFHALASFYWRFIQNFISIIIPLTKCMKGGRFTWTSKAAKAFDILKAMVIEALVLALPNFDEVFQVECDASEVGIEVGIGGVLRQNQRPIAFFSEKLNDTRRKYSIYDKEFYAIVCSLDTWRHYLLYNEYVLFLIMKL